MSATMSQEAALLILPTVLLLVIEAISQRHGGEIMVLDAAAVKLLDQQGQIRIDGLFRLRTFRNATHSICGCYLNNRNTRE